MVSLTRDMHPPGQSVAMGCRRCHGPGAPGRPRILPAQNRRNAIAPSSGVRSGARGGVRCRGAWTHRCSGRPHSPHSAGGVGAAARHDEWRPAWEGLRMRDPYEVLGVSKTASAAEIKSAFRRQAKKLHPDANKHDPRAATRFAELNAAYEILGEEGKRKAFDRGEIDAEGKPRFQGFEGFSAGRGPGAGFGQDGIFETFTWGRDGFQRGGGRSGGGFRGFGGFEDILKEAFGGAARGGRSGGGSQFEQESFGGVTQDVTAALTITLAEAAKGAQKRVQLPTGKEVDVKIPPGLNDGQTIRLKG